MEEIEYFILVNKDRLQFIGKSFDFEKIDEDFILKCDSIERAKDMKKQLESSMEKYKEDKILIYRVEEKIDRSFKLIEE